MNQYQHDDISSLAKSLRKQLAARSEPAGHVEWLNMLAKATGAQNYQSWLATRPSAEVGASEEMASLELRLNWHLPGWPLAEVDADGRAASRQGATPKSYAALIDIELRSLSSKPHFIRVRASVDASLYTGGRAYEDWIRPYVIPALVDLAERHPERLTILGNVDLPIDRYVLEGRQLRVPESWRSDRTVQIPTRDLQRLQRLCSDAVKAGREFEMVKDRLWDLLGNSDPVSYARQNRRELTDLADYLERYLEAEADLFLAGWNGEKLGSIADALRRAATDPESAVKRDWEWMRRDSLSAKSPPHWNRFVSPPASLAKGTVLLLTSD